MSVFCRWQLEICPSCAHLFTCSSMDTTTSLLLLLSRFSRVRLCATPETAAHQAPPSLGVSRQEHWSGLPFSSPMHESEKSKWSRSVVSDSVRPHELQPTRLLRPWDFPGKSTGVGATILLVHSKDSRDIYWMNDTNNFVEIKFFMLLYSPM